MAIRPPPPQQFQRHNLNSADTHQSEKEARQRIEQIHTHLKNTIAESDQTLDRIENDFNQRRAYQLDKQEQTLREEKQRGIEELQRLKDEHRKEVKRLKKESEREVESVKSAYKNQLYSVATHGEKSIQRKTSELKTQSDYLLNQQREVEKSNQEQKIKRINSIGNETEKQVSQFKSSQLKKIKKIQDNSQSDLSKLKSNISSRKKDLVMTQRSEIQKIQDKTKSEIEKIQNEFSQKIDTYKKMQQDPFYSLVEIDADLIENKDAFILKAKIPQYEQKNVKVNIVGDQLILSGIRRNQEQRTDGDGKTLKTSSYQSYTKTFPLNWPVNQNELVRLFDNETVTIKIPKKLEGFSEENLKAKLLAKSEELVPYFPKSMEPSYYPFQNTKSYKKTT